MLLSHEKEGKLPLVTAWKDLEGIMMLNKIRQKRSKEITNTVCYHLPEDSKEAKFIEIVEWWLPGAGWWGKRGHVGQRV